MHGGRVMTVDLAGRAETIVEVPNQPSGLGWLPDGTLLVVSMTDRKVLRLEGTTLREHADLSDIATFHCNDMVVAAEGTAYVGNFGFDLFARATPVMAKLARVTPDGKAFVAAEEMSFPNGSVITPDGRTLIVGESGGARLTAFDIAADGTLSNRRVWADLSPHVPDGICLDSEGAIWSADPLNGVCIRVRDGGEVVQKIETGRGCFACMLGGPDRRTLFLLTADDSDPEKARAARSGRIETVRVDAPGAGLP
jgi:sugar lactone lactonase YvrE